MRRIGLAVALTLSLALAPHTAEAQAAGKAPRVAYLSIAPRPSPRSDALAQGLHELGYVEGQSLTLEYRWGQGKPDRLRALAVELAALKVDVIVTGGPTATQAARDATRSIPIVMAFDSDPVEEGFVASLARPGGNITGLTNLNSDLSQKRLDLLKELVPGISRVAVLTNSKTPGIALASRGMVEAARTLGLRLQILDVQGPGDFENAFRAAGMQHADALVALPTPVLLFNHKPVVALAARYRLPAIYWERRFAEAGGLMSYAPSDLGLHRRAAIYVDKILRGAKPSDLPVEQATKYELVINLKTAKALGLTIPQTLLLQADQVIE